MPSSSNGGHIAGGEHPDGRRAMREVERRLRQNEGYSSEKAREKAREAALRHDRKRNR